jgi:hypothetical protein
MAVNLAWNLIFDISRTSKIARGSTYLKLMSPTRGFSLILAT